MNMKSILLRLIAFSMLVAGTQSASAASATAIAEFLGVSISTTGTATATLGADFALVSLSDTTGGVDDIENNGTSFSSTLSSFGEGTAFNGGITGSSNFAEATGTNDAFASSLVETELLLDGEGTVTIDFGYDLFADAFDNASTDAFATAIIEVFAGSEFDSLTVAAPLVTGLGSDDFATGVLSLTLDVFGTETIFIGATTVADVSSVVPVPAAVWLMGSALVGLVGLRKKSS